MQQLHKPGVYVAGHTGLLGSAIVRAAMADARYDLILRTRRELDLLDCRAVGRFLEQERPDSIILSAAKVGGIQANINDPVGFLLENQIINANVIGGALQAGVRKMIYVGSSCMYPRDYMSPLKEEYILAAPLEPTNEGYALAKISGARLCEYCNRQHSTNYRVLIPCNLYGSGDHFDPVSAHLIPAAISKLHQAKMNRERSVTIWGDGKARREFLFVEDLARFMVDCLDHLEGLPDYLNVGYGSDFSVLEYYRMAAEVIGYTGDFEFDTTRPVGMARKLLDSSRAAAYGWHPATDPSEGISLTYSHYLDTLENN